MYMLKKGGSDSWETKKVLFDSMVSSTLLYASEIWSLKYLDAIEVVQLKFIKYLFGWPRNTPNYIVRIETGRNPLSIKVIKKLITLWTKLSHMSDERLPKLCFERLKAMDKNKPDIVYNWVSQVRTLADLNSFTEELSINHSNGLIRFKEDILEKVRNHYISIDIQRILKSTNYPLYRILCSYNISEPETYLTFQVHIKKLRCISQLRVANTEHIRLYSKNQIFSFKSEEICISCKQYISNSLYHILLHCPAYTEHRHQFLQPFISTSTEEHNIQDILNFNSIDKLNKVYYFMMGVYKVLDSETNN